MENLEYVIKRIREEVARAGSQVALSQEWGLAQTYISDILLGNRPPSDRVLGYLGLRVMAVPMPDQVLINTVDVDSAYTTLTEKCEREFLDELVRKLLHEYFLPFEI